MRRLILCFKGRFITDRECVGIEKEQDFIEISKARKIE